MSSLDEENTAPSARQRRSDAGKGNEPRHKKRPLAGCTSLVMYVIITGLVALPLFYIVMDRTDIGPKVRGKKDQLLEKVLPTRTEVVEKIVEVEKVVEKIVEVPAPPPPLPNRYVASKKIDTAKLWTGLPVKSEIVSKEGSTATKERAREDSYGIELKIKITVPKANQTVDDLASLNPHLPKMLPDLGKLVESSKVSGFYHQLYQLKQDRIQQNATRLDRVLSRHNFYDCETILEITHPETSKRLLLMQGEMDVVTDGSDGDRMAELDDYISMSTHYQPFTSYAWPKKTPTPNPLLARWESALKKYEAEFAIPGLSIEKNRALREQIARLKPGVLDMKNRSFLIAEADPFVVIPLSLLGRTKQNSFAPSIGDYCVVIHEDKAYPAIAGDAGPTYKMGEASLRLAKTINENASPYSRPVSDLHVTYLVFPGSAEEKPDAPNYSKWREKCAELLNGIGGLGDGYDIFEWEDTIAKMKAEKAAALAKEAADAEAADAVTIEADAASKPTESIEAEGTPATTEPTAIPRTETE